MKKMFSTRIEPELYDKLTEMADLEMRSQANMLEIIITHYYEYFEKTKNPLLKSTQKWVLFYLQI